MNSGVKEKWIEKKKSDDNEVTIVGVSAEKKMMKKVWGVCGIYIH